MNFRFLLIAACVALRLGDSFAQDLPAYETSALDIQQRADLLMESARHLSDIRAVNAPGFRLTAKFSFIGRDLEKVDGTYTEVWTSSSQWRREIVIGQQRRVEVGGAGRFWRLDNSDEFPQEAERLPGTINTFPPESSHLPFESIVSHDETHPPVVCAIAKPEGYRHRSAYCFDKRTGALLEKTVAEVRPRNIVENSCDYRSFQKFGDLWLSSEISCYEDRHHKLNIQLSEFTLDPTPDSALFAQPAGAIEVGMCPTAPSPPRAISINSEMLSPSQLDHTYWTTVWFIVGIDGKPRDAKIVGLGRRNKASSDRILRRISNWKFKPGTCDGKVLPLPLTLKLPD